MRTELGTASRFVGVLFFRLLIAHEALAEAPCPSIGTGREDGLHEAGCYIRSKQYERALAIAEPLARPESRDSEPFLYVGIARYHTGALTEARAALEEARRREPRRAEADLYLGLVHLAGGEAAAALEAFEAARTFDAGAVEPLASYYAGLAALDLGQPERGRDALQRVVALAPDTAWSRAAARALSRADRPTAGPGRTWWVKLTGGWEYDDNALLRAGDVPLAAEISSQRDTRAMWRVQLGTELFRDRKHSAGLMLRYSGTEHEHLDALDVHDPHLSLWFDRRISEGVTGRLLADYGHSWVDGRSLLDSLSLSPTLFVESGAGRTQLFTRLYRYEYHLDQVDVPDGWGFAFARCPSLTYVVCGPAGVDEEDARDRDGFGFGAGFEHTVPLDGLRSELLGGYVLHRYWAQGKEQSFLGHEFRLGWTTRLPWKVRFSARASYVYRPFRHASSVPDPERIFLNREYPVDGSRRRDDVLGFRAGIERPFGEFTTISLLYGYTDNDSNRDVFDYNRQVVGLYVTFRFGSQRSGGGT